MRKIIKITPDEIETQVPENITILEAAKSVQKKLSSTRF